MTEQRYMDTQGAEYLMAAIIKQAALDYWHDCEPTAYKRPRRLNDEDYKKHCQRIEFERKRRKSEVRMFFRSPWFRTLCQDSSITGNMMIEQIEKLRKENKHILYSEFVGEDFAENPGMSELECDYSA